jgi:EF-P beta-lysylation protein EpmB
VPPQHRYYEKRTDCRRADWQEELAQGVTDLETLCRYLRLDPAAFPSASDAMDAFPLRVPHSYLHRIRPGDPDDPLLRQILPSEEETRKTPGFCRDPLREASAQIERGLLQKYAQRALLLVSERCGVHCRYCFRRHRNGMPGVDLRPALTQIAEDPRIEEVILSGGDPLMLDDESLRQVFYYIEEIPHVKRVRIHTRLPVVLPARVTPLLLEVLEHSRKSCWVVLHINHADELSSDVEEAIGALGETVSPLLSQSVLLRGVNDRFGDLEELFMRLVELRVVPYYLHQIDRVDGAAHFEVPEAEGVKRIEELRACLPGFAIPRYVREVPGVPYKVVIA